MKKTLEDIKTAYLFIACAEYNTEESKASLAVLKASLYAEMSIEFENIGDQAILFTSTIPMGDIRKKIQRYKMPFLLIDISVSYDLEALSGFFPDSSLEVIKNVTKNKFSLEKPALDNRLENAVEEEKYELAAVLRDLKINTL